MRKKRLTSLLALLLLLSAAACASLQLPGAAADTAATQAAPQNQNQLADSIEGRLAMGTLSLEGGELAVTAAQAADLLPLWKAVKSLSASQTASAEEITALYAQIEETMTAEQLQAIQNMALGQEDMAALMEKYGVQMQAPQGGNEISEELRATRIAQIQAEGGGTGGRGQGSGFAGGMPPDGGFPGGGMLMDGGDLIGQPTPGAQRTFVPGQGGRAGRGMNTLFVDPLITLLRERAGL